MTLLLQQNLGTAWGENTAAATVTRRGMQGRGRARNRGRTYRLFWLIAAVLGSGWV